jgi:hypothetical protein
VASVLWLHVGPPKTGTTTIQAALRVHRRPLRRAGLLVPELRAAPGAAPGRHHHGFAKAALDPEMEDHVAAEIAAIEDSPETIISSEWFCARGPGRADRLARLAERLCKRYAVRVIYYARPPVALATSQAQQSLKTGARRLEEVMARPRPYELRRHLTELAEAFGAAALVVRPFLPEAFRGGDLLEDFATVLGWPGALSKRAIGERNQALSLDAARRLDALRAAGVAGMIRADDPRLGPPGGPAFALPDATRQRILRDSAADLDWLAATHGVDLREA